MGKFTMWRLGLARAITCCVVAGFAGSCSDAPVVPAPVIMKGALSTVGGEEGPVVVPTPAAIVPAPAAVAAAPAAVGPRQTRHIIVERGQSLGGIAHLYHVPSQMIIAANHLTPPYGLKAGTKLVIPDAAEPGVQSPSAPQLAAVAQAPAPHAATPPEIIPLDGPEPPPRAAEKPAAPIAAAPPPPEAATHESRTAPPKPTPPAPPAATAPPAKSAAEPPVAAAAPPPRGDQFPWPVRGRVVAGYGVAAGGSHNDGINIAAARGTPVRAVDAGIVAYAGNELRGYGNLVLVKHNDGWISAYAHCDEVLVKRGDKVSRGEVIAKVGATGGVTEPQLHFELRQGKRPVDPQQFLPPAPSAEHGAPGGAG